MASGKTEELQRRVRRVRIAGRPLRVFRPESDHRKPGTHDGRQFDGVPVETIIGRGRPHVRSGAVMVVLDEVQFFDSEAVLGWVRHWMARGIEVVAGGLDLDYRGEPFPTTAGLLALADDVVKLRAVCTLCGADASRSQRLVADAGVVLIGGLESYAPRCVPCFNRSTE